MTQARLTGFLTAVLLVIAAPSAFASGAWKHPNKYAYKISPEQFWSGHSGRSTVSARALMNANGAVTLEVTAGEFESATPSPGKLSFVTVVSLGGHRGTNILRTYLVNSSTWSRTYQGMKRGQGFIVLAGVRGMDGPFFTRLVTVGGRVKLAPELSVTHINAPAKAPVGTPVMIMASIEELNTDVGARTDCVLSVDGQAVDEARGIWVDSGGIVTCAFSYAFPSVGTKNLRVSLVNTRPQDYDPQNDAALKTIEVISPVQGMAFNAWAEDRSFDAGGYAYGWYQQSNGTYRTTPDWEGNHGSNGWTQFARINAWVGEYIPFEGTSLRVLQETGGEVLHQAQHDDLQNSWASTDPNGNANECIGRWDDASSTHLYMCITGGAYPLTQIDYFREAGQAVYWSRRYGQHWHGWHDDYEYSMSTGAQAVYGSTYRMRVELVRGEESWLADTTIDLTPVTHRVDNPYRCWEETTETGGVGRVCAEDHDYLDGSSGETSNL